MNPHLTNLQKLLSQPHPIDKECYTIIEAFETYIKALYKSLSDKNAQKLYNLLYLLLRDQQKTVIVFNTRSQE